VLRSALSIDPALSPITDDNMGTEWERHPVEFR
jgi:hypothetical protein